MFASYLGAKGNPRVYGNLITIFITFGYLLASIFFWRAGKKYKEHIENEQEQKGFIEMGDGI